MYSYDDFISEDVSKKMRKITFFNGERFVLEVWKSECCYVVNVVNEKNPRKFV